MRLRGTFAVTEDVRRYPGDVRHYGGRSPLPGNVRRYPDTFPVELIWLQGTFAVTRNVLPVQGTCTIVGDVLHYLVDV